MRHELQLRTALAILLVVLLAVSSGSVIAGELTGPPEHHDHMADVVTLADGTQLWPYTSRDPTFEQRTLSINVVIYGDPARTEFLLRNVPLQDWEDVEEGREDISPAEQTDAALNETGIGLGTAAGADRWIWVAPNDGEPQWLQEAYQLEQGDYLGLRHHLRAYGDPSGNSWTVIQAHGEHWDWFHLRHTVHSIEESQVVVEEEFLGRLYVESLQRERFGNDQSADADGWVTIVTLDEDFLAQILGFIVFGIAGLATTYRSPSLAELRNDPEVVTAVRALAAVLAVVLAYHTIRFGAIGLERYFLGTTPRLIVAVFYPLLVIGMPIIAYLSARKLDISTAFAAVTIGFVIAVFIDYTYLGVTRIPLETFVHRGSLAIAIGLIAAGASKSAREPDIVRGYVRTGVLLWILAIVIPLLQFL